jgi:hypothetical protein
MESPELILNYTKNNENFHFYRTNKFKIIRYITTKVLHTFNPRYPRSFKSCLSYYYFCKKE